MLDGGWPGGLSGVLWGAAGGLITWFGTEISRRVTMAREKREHAARALAELLEIRRYLMGFKLMRQELEAIVGTSISNLMPTMHALLPQLVAIDWVALGTRYNTAVTALAGLRPVLAYNLRSRDLVVPFLQRFGAAALQDAETAKAWPMLEQLISGYGLTALTDAILMLARKHSWTTLWETKKAIKEQDRIPPELRTSLLEWVKQAAAQQAAAQTGQSKE
jgi:hypothetical protein